MLCSGFSTRLMISRSTVSGDAPGYGKLITMTGCSTSGIWLTRRFFNASRPRHMSTITIAIVVTGCLILKLERNISGSLFLVGDDRGGGTDLHRLPIFQGAVWITQHLVTLGNATLQCERAGAGVALAEPDRHLL